MEGKEGSGYSRCYSSSIFVGLIWWGILKYIVKVATLHH